MEHTELLRTKLFILRCNKCYENMSYAIIYSLKAFLVCDLVMGGVAWLIWSSRLLCGVSKGRKVGYRLSASLVSLAERGGCERRRSWRAGRWYGRGICEISLANG